MSSQVSLWPSLDRWSSPTLRWRPAVLTVLALAAGCTIYYHRDSIPFAETPPDRASDLHRSNAIRLRRTQADLDRSYALRLRRARHEEALAEPPDPSTDLAFLDNDDESQAILGYHSLHTPNGSRVVQFALNRDVLRVYDEHPDFAGEPRGRYSIQSAFLRLYLFKHLPMNRMGINPSPMFSEALIDRLRDLGFHQSIAADVVLEAEAGGLPSSVGDWLANQELLCGPGGIIIADPDMLRDIRALQTQTTGRQTVETVADTDNDGSVHEEEGHDEAKTRVLNLLFRIAEEQSRREGYVHRGITCNGCGTSPLKGIRYRCSNCNDFDLCEHCESQQIHQKNHIFFKVRIPSPYVRNQTLDVMYPARYPASHHHLSKQQIKKFSEATGYKENEVEGFWEQFKCMASTEWPADPNQLCIAVDHRNLEQLFIHTNSGRPPPPNLVYDRVFHFYDTDDNDLIGFEEFVGGLANLSKKGPKQKWARIFKCYDLNGDGYVDRKDFLRMLKAHYALTQEMTAELVAHMEEDFNEEETRELISGGRPLAAAFTEGSVGEGQTPPEIGEGKRLDGFGDPVIIDNEAMVKDQDYFEVKTAETIANFAEENAFGDVKQHENDIQQLVFQVYNERLPGVLELYRSYFNAEPRGDDFAGIDWTRQEKDDEVAAKIHNHMAEEWRDRHFVRCSAVKDRERRKGFFPANGVSNDPKMVSESGDNAGYDNPLRAYMIQRAHEAVSQDEESTEEFKQKALHLCGSLAHDRRALVKHMMTVSDLEWSEDEIVEGLRGHSLDTPQVRAFVVSWFKLLEEHAPPPLPTPAVEENAIKVSATPSRRSRSSSKVRFEDGLTSNEHEPDTRSVTSISSRSIPVNERWGSLELPEPEEDFGREVLYEVVQESMNDIIDSIFKIREDLWIEAQMSKIKRQEHGELVLDAAYKHVTSPIKLLDYLHIFLRQARIAQDYPPASDPVNVRSGADRFWHFLGARIEESETPLTASRCSSCEDEWVFFGGWCKCGTGSAQKKLLLLDRSKSARTEKCQTCAQRGQDKIKRQDDSCEWCGTMSAERAQEDQWARGVLSKLKDPDGSSSNPVDLSSAADRHEMKAKAEASAAQEDVEGTKAGASPKPRSASPSGSALPADDPSRQTEISQTPPDAGLIGNQSADVTVETAQNEAGSAPQDYPEMAHDLHNSVRSFDAANLSVEDTTMRKPLEKLLEESGYSSVDLLQKHDPQVASPAPPLSLTHSHLPRSSSIRSGTVEEEEEEDEEEDKLDPTLPQHRPDEVWTGGVYKAILEEEARRLEPTGSSWRTPPKGKKGKKKSNSKKEPETPNKYDLVFWAALTLLEAEDEKRGGPGRLSQSEFLEIMMNERGRKLEFLGDWMNMTVF